MERIMSLLGKKGEKILGKIFGSLENDCKDSFIGKMNIKKYLIWFLDLIDNLKEVLNTSKNFGYIWMNLSMGKSRQANYNLIEYGKTFIMRES